MVYPIQETVLLIDDDSDDQQLFREALEVINPELIFHGVFNGIEALEKLKTPPPPKAIFMDINMPQMDGFQCLKALKASKDLSGIPVIMFSTSRSPDDIRRALDLGAIYFITKTDTFNALVVKLNEVIQKIP